MRIGQNPAKLGLPAYLPKPLGVFILTYVPSLDGYFSQSLEVLRIQIGSLLDSSPDFDLVVFDNGSCPEVREELMKWQNSGLIQSLHLSGKYIGKCGALNWCLASMPNEWICYSDGDILFRPGWWEHSLEIMQTFPQAGMVIAQPCLFDALKGSGRAIHLLEKNRKYKMEEFFPSDEVFREFGHGIVLKDDRLEQIMKQPVPVIRDVKSGLSAVVGASHMQFLVKREVARNLVPLEARFALNSREDMAFNKRVDELGLLHLSTLQPYVFHMGNFMDEQTMAEVRARNLEKVAKVKLNPSRLQLSGAGKAKRRLFRAMDALSRIPFMNKFIKRLYNFLFEYSSGG